MNFNLHEVGDAISSLEIELIINSSSSTGGTFDHWSILNTINHVCSWKNHAINKVESRQKGEPVNYHSSTTTVDQVNHHYFDKTRDYSSKQTIEVINDTKIRIKSITESIKGNESSTQLVPSGFKGNVFDYLKMELVYHPVDHYIYYSLKNDEFMDFTLLEKLIYKYRQTAFNDLGVLDFSEFMEPKLFDTITNKGVEWKNDDLYIHVISRLKER